MPLLPEAKNCDVSVKKNFRRISKELGYTGSPTFANTTITNVITAGTSVFSKICTVAAGINVLRVTGLQTDDTALTGTLRGAYIDVSNGSTAATGTIRALELKARTEAPGDTGNDVTVLEGLSISADSKGHSVTTMRAAEFILDGKTGGTITEAVGLRIANNLQVDKATASYGLQIYRDSFDYTYDITLSLGGHITGNSYVNQDLRTSASPTFVGGTFSAVVTGISPTTGDHFATKEYVDLAIGTEIDFFLSNTASGVGSNYLMYAHDTGDPQSTLDTTTDYPTGLGTGLNQLIFSFLTEAGQPGVKYLRDGVYDAHVHLHRSSGNKPTNIYWTLSYVDADGSSGEQLVVIGETSGLLTNSSIPYDLHAVLTPEVNIDITKRLLVKMYANVGATGSPVTITLAMEGTTDSHISIEVPSDIWQRYGAVLDDLNTLGQVGADSEFLVGTGNGVLAWENAATAATSMGLGIGDSPQFTAVNIGHASDTTITRASAGNLNIEGNLVYRAGGTDVPIGDGGTGQSTAQLAINALSAVGAATNEHVLTKDTGTGNAIWKVAGAGASTWIALTDTDPANYTGQAGSAVVVNAGEDGLEFGAAPGGAFTSQCSVYLSGDQTINHNTLTLLEFDTEDYDNNTEFDTGTHLWTAKANGYYTVHATIHWIGGVDNSLEPHSLHIKVDGVEVARFNMFQPDFDGVPAQAVTKDLYLTTGQTVGLWAFQHRENTSDVDSRSSRSWASIRRFA